MLKVVILGSGTPNPLPERSGPCVAVIAGGRAYLVDLGDSCIRQCEAANQKGLNELRPDLLENAFLTHLHSDHTIGLPAFILTPWVLERQNKPNIYGPSGTKHMVDNVVAAYAMDVDARLNGLEGAVKSGCGASPVEIEAGIIYEDEYVTVEAFPVNHPPFEAYGYRFTHERKTVVISGDTTPCDSLLDYAKDCDILVHEVYSATNFNNRSPKWQKYHAAVHTSSVELGEIALKANPGQLVLYHQLFMAGTNEKSGKDAVLASEAGILADIGSRYGGPVISSKDLDIVEC